MELTLALIVTLWPHGAAPAPQGSPPQGCEQHADRVYTRNEVDQKARVTHRPEPLYPEKARRKRLKGRVNLQLVLRPDGRVTDIEVLESSDESFSQTSIEAAKKIRFEPALKGGCAVAQSNVVFYSYNTY